MIQTPSLIVIAGPAATGKSSLAAHLSRELGLPFFSKDQFKEPLYDAFGFPDLAGHRRMGAVAHSALNRVCETLVASSVSQILEAPFLDDPTSLFLNGLRARHPFRFAQIQMRCEGTVLLERFLAREREGRVTRAIAGRSSSSTCARRSSPDAPPPSRSKGPCA